MEISSYNEATVLLKEIDAVKKELERLNNQDFNSGIIVFKNYDEEERKEFDYEFDLPEDMVKIMFNTLVNYYKSMLSKLEYKFKKL